MIRGAAVPPKLPRRAKCHPERKSLALGLCRQCYRLDPVRRAKEDESRRKWMQKDRLTNPEKYKLRDHLRYLADPAKKRDCARRWRLANLERVRKCQRRWYSANADKMRGSQFKRKYGVDISVLDVLMDAQGGCCRLCSQSGPLALDHDHVTGHLRGLLCQQCNLALGLFYDDVATLQRAIDYLLPHVKFRSEAGST